MTLSKNLLLFSAIVFICVHFTKTENEASDIEKIFSSCKKRSPEFDSCVKRALNKLRPYFKRGIPEMKVAPFDPHFAKEVKQTRSIAGVGYTLLLKDVYERGWTQSIVTKYKTDWDNERIIYSQYFPEKYLNGDYEFKVQLLSVEEKDPPDSKIEVELNAALPIYASKIFDLARPRYKFDFSFTKIHIVGNAFGLGTLRSGTWNLTLRDYSQTTRIKRSETGMDVHVEVDHIGDMEIHVSNLLRERGILERMLDRVINFTWKPGFAVIRPLINDLVSTAFTDIWSESFKDFPLQLFIKD